ncbi:MAG TPA: PAS domain S-box protein [Noviherbaspirillum sp.]|uniref:PAS domain-containing sensor histidine kinase n=1 Tax=Noviherbaspirillum sp. TaxID=1926288 RepID=UPI002D6AC942|nr:PAS domain S-box protein [Noviherbaspirillum sp.]HYD94163.1 PAS domain S-box protein [Noviherbaspirillum sp.]
MDNDKDFPDNPPRQTPPKSGRALRASEEQFRLLVQGVVDYAIYMLSPAGEITNWNSGAQRIKGYAADEVIGTHFSRFYTEEDRAVGLPMKALATAAQEGRFESEGWRVRKDGSRFWTHAVIDAIRDDDGQLIGFAKVTRDITERRAAAQALEEARSRLLQSQKLEAIGKLTGGVAHDFNNLLTVIVNSLELLSREVQTPNASRLIGSAQAAARRGALLTQQLLTFARRQPLRSSAYNLNTLIGGFEAILRRACQDRITFEVNLAPRLKSVWLDATQFEAALLNLVVNARDAMPDGGLLSVSTDNVTLGANAGVGTLEPGHYVRLTVRDTGCGMTPEVLQHAFEPFYTTKEIGKGSGMGLSQVYGFVAQSGGDVVLESEPGKGTAVHLYLPVLAAENGGAPENGGEPEQKKQKVLIVEDEPDVLAVSVELFRSIGYEVVTAGNGADATGILKRADDIDVLFTDVVMPGMDGIELARFTHELGRGIRIILASGYPAPALADKGDLGDFAFIRKPYRLPDLMQALQPAATEGAPAA